MVKISLNGLKFHAYHGVLPQERIVGNDFVVHICIYADVLEAVKNDDITATISYADIYAIAKKEMATPSKLIENVCHRILCGVMNFSDRITKAVVTVEKLNPPLGADITSASVTLEKVRTL